MDADLDSFMEYVGGETHFPGGFTHKGSDFVLCDAPGFGLTSTFDLPEKACAALRHPCARADARPFPILRRDEHMETWSFYSAGIRIARFWPPPARWSGRAWTTGRAFGRARCNERGERRMVCQAVPVFARGIF
ncbi:MAG: hypothetical protein ACLRZH_09360 [Ruthenibacterium lactatiformans]